MTDATKVSGTEIQASLLGLDVYMVQIELGGTETLPTTLETGFRSVVHAQATWAETPTSANSLVVSVSGGTITVTATGAVSGSGNAVWVLAYGYRG